MILIFNNDGTLWKTATLLWKYVTCFAVVAGGEAIIADCIEVLLNEFYKCVTL